MYFCLASLRRTDVPFLSPSLNLSLSFNFHEGNTQLSIDFSFFFSIFDGRSLSLSLFFFNRKIVENLR